MIGNAYITYGYLGRLGDVRMVYGLREHRVLVVGVLHSDRHLGVRLEALRRAVVLEGGMDKCHEHEHRQNSFDALLHLYRCDGAK